MQPKYENHLDYYPQDEFLGTVDSFDVWADPGHDAISLRYEDAKNADDGFYYKERHEVKDDHIKFFVSKEVFNSFRKAFKLWDAKKFDPSISPNELPF